MINGECQGCKSDELFGPAADKVAEAGVELSLSDKVTRIRGIMEQLEREIEALAQV